jgi:hypothetical protein
MSFAWTPEYTEGDEVEEKNAAGEVCVYYKMPDVLKRVTFELAVCNPEPELEELLIGGTILEDGSDVVGWAAPETGVEATPNGVAFELWSRAIVGGKPAAVLPYFRDGPHGDWPYISDRAYQYARVASFPSGINGFQAVIADS